jgi:hypothetical protein
MHKILIIVFIFLTQYPIDKRACETFATNLNLIKASVEKKDGIDAAKVSQAIIFLEQITSIKSQSDGNFFGRFNPTAEDYNNWNTWFKKNKAKLYWDYKENKVKVK